MHARPTLGDHVSANAKSHSANTSLGASSGRKCPAPAIVFTSRFGPGRGSKSHRSELEPAHRQNCRHAQLRRAAELTQTGHVPAEHQQHGSAPVEKSSALSTRLFLRARSSCGEMRAELSVRSSKHLQM
jgi:hypothetical protein